MPNSGSNDHGRDDFTTTNWTVVVEAGWEDCPRAAAALERLCQIYWYPIYAFVRRRGIDQHTAEDLAQSFFACLLEKDMLKRVDRQKGKFRSFLLAALTNFLANDWDMRHAAKRGGRLQIISLDGMDAEDLYQNEPIEPLTPEKLFERSWAFTLLERALERLKQEYVSAKRAELFAKLEPALTREATPGFYAATATELKMTEGAVKVALHRLRRRFGEFLRSEVAHTVSRPQEIDEEIRHLFAAISASSG